MDQCSKERIIAEYLIAQIRVRDVSGEYLASIAKTDSVCDLRRPRACSVAETPRHIALLSQVDRWLHEIAVPRPRLLPFFEQIEQSEAEEKRPWTTSEIVAQLCIGGK